MLFQEWDEYPRCAQTFGLVPRNPWKILALEALSSLPDLTDDFQFMPKGQVWHAFTDGSCDPSSSPEEALAAWSVVIAHHGAVSAGPLPGPQQTILRAEIYADRKSVV